MNGVFQRARGVLVAAAVVIVAVDSIGLGLDWANAVRDGASSAAPRTRAQQTVPSPVVDAADNPLISGQPGAGLRGGAAGGTASSPLVGPPVVAAPSGGTTSPSNPGPSAPAPVVPLAQIDAAVPMLGLQASLGLGDGACNTVDLTVIALGDCSAPTGDGPVILHLGGSLLGN
jgi:hypothetical protein